ncbi:MAG: twin transmembrane helix small protein [Xanthobacteraceae bacterium]|nr:twin transmembrane helix small protein [Xanthobacteraceae bacterium]QYK44778.1 MAG: twin transmembrane helix small protein [Xanthobacteraceae bacterium]
MASTLQYFLVPAALIAVTIVLVLGLWNLMKGGSSSRSQSLMRMRVALQALAIAIVMGMLWFLGK